MNGTPVDPREHLGLVHKYARGYELRFGLERGHLDGVAYEVICDACRTYDPARGAISTHLVAALKWQLPMRIRKERHDVRSRKCADGRFRDVSFKHGRLPESDDGQDLLPAPETSAPTGSPMPLLAHLSDRDRAVLVLRAQGLTLEEVAAAVQLSKERVRQIEMASLESVRTRLRQNAQSGESAAVMAIESQIHRLATFATKPPTDRVGLTHRTRTAPRPAGCGVVSDDKEVA